jgi:Domain of unknown function (DUF4157)/OmpA family
MFAAPVAKARTSAASMARFAGTLAARKKHSGGAGGRQRQIAPLWDFASLAVVPPETAHPKLVIGDENDAAEQEADRVAENLITGGLPASVSRSGPTAVQRKCAACEAHDEEAADRLDRRAASRPGGGNLAPAIVDEVLGTPGMPLDRKARAFFEPRFGQDLANVRIHADAKATESARAVNAMAYRVGNHIVVATGATDIESHTQRRLLAHELVHVVQQSGRGRPLLRRQKPKTIGGPLDLKPDVCITLPDPIGTRCGQEAADLCKKFPSIPAVCGPICAVFDCSRPKEPKTVCRPNWRAATSTEFEGQCCKGGIDNVQSCCPPSRISWAEDRCCAEGEIVVDNHCKKISELPPIDPGMLCPPERRTIRGECCVPPMVPQGAICALPEPETPKPPVPGGPLPQLGILWTDEIHFQQDHPTLGERDPGRILTAEGQRELDSVLSWLDLSADLQVRLIGHASSEGTEDYNQALATRRASFVAAAIAARGFAARIVDPLLSDGAESGCQRIGAGLWSCGELKADPNGARPEDRVVRVTFARNSLPPLKLEPPAMPPPF